MWMTYPYLVVNRKLMLKFGDHPGISIWILQKLLLVRPVQELTPSYGRRSPTLLCKEGAPTIILNHDQSWSRITNYHSSMFIMTSRLSLIIIEYHYGNIVSHKYSLTTRAMHPRVWCGMHGWLWVGEFLNSLIKVYDLFVVSLLIMGSFDCTLISARALVKGNMHFW